jgi:hypothetical protein
MNLPTAERKTALFLPEMSPHVSLQLSASFLAGIAARRDLVENELRIAMVIVARSYGVGTVKMKFDATSLSAEAGIRKDRLHQYLADLHRKGVIFLNGGESTLEPCPGRPLSAADHGQKLLPLDAPRELQESLAQCSRDAVIAAGWSQVHAAADGRLPTIADPPLSAAAADRPPPPLPNCAAIAAKAPTPCKSGASTPPLTRASVSCSSAQPFKAEAEAEAKAAAAAQAKLREEFLGEVTGCTSRQLREWERFLAEEPREAARLLAKLRVAKKDRHITNPGGWMCRIRIDERGRG